jgi:DNA-binding response OmpR family regulator
LFRIEGTHREEIRNLRPQEHKLVRYMDQRNRANNHTPVMCTYEELIEAIWGDEPDHMNSEVNHLVFGLRQKIELDPGEPQFLQSVPGLGYRLETRALM